jgi:2-succinyl-5-enolpyruvyl-6-hydroxy-3-cyclohexene-1-carboxylate synthase
VSVPREPGCRSHPPPPSADVQASRAVALVDEWVRAGVRHAVICPGSRSTPLALALVGDNRLRSHVRLDERSAAFAALGVGLATGVPAVVCVTSGTAAAELHAAATEAHHARIPLLLCTADRPNELHDVGASQTIDQTDLYGAALRWRVDLGVADPVSRHAWRSLAARAVAEATSGPMGPGPVHVNVPAREPLVGEPSWVPEGRPDGGPWHRVSRRTGVGAVTSAVDDGGLGMWAGRRGVIVAGAGCGEPQAVCALGDALGWPVLADPRSGCRHEGTGVIAAADPILRHQQVAERLQPEVIVRIGTPWVSKVVGSWVTSAVAAGATEVVIDPYWTWPDPERSAHRMVVADPSSWCREMVQSLAGPLPKGASGRRTEPAWRAAWDVLESAAQLAIDRWCHSRDDLSEPALARAVVAAVAGRATLVVSSSMPVRDVESYGGVPDGGPATVFANRGASGIDGVVSTALGVALASGPTVALVGDLAFLHDLTALLRGPGQTAPCVVVVVDNGGGGIFSFLPTAALVGADRFERVFATPQAIDIAASARGLGVEVTEVTSTVDVTPAITDALEGGDLRVVRAEVVGREANVSAHAELDRRVAEALDAVNPW